MLIASFRLELSQKVNAKLSILAEKFSETKFLLIRSTGEQEEALNPLDFSTAAAQLWFNLQIAFPTIRTGVFLRF